MRISVGQESTGEKPPRKPPRHKGQKLLTPRDLELLRWIGDQYAAHQGQVQELLGRQPLGPTKRADAVEATTTKRVIERWVQGGWVESRKVFIKQPPWVWLNRHGIEQLGLKALGYSYRRAPAVSMLPHYEAVNRVRLYVEGPRYPQEVVWRSERLLKPQDAREGAGHVVDAEMVTQGTTVAIEVERTTKRLDDLMEILESLADAYEWIWYFTTPETHEGVIKGVGRLAESRRKPFRVAPLTSLP